MSKILGARYMNRCGNCKHWKPHTEPGCEGFGKCALCADFAELYPPSCDEHAEVRKHKFGAVDGSGYHAALITRDTFGCTEWQCESD